MNYNYQSLIQCFWNIVKKISKVIYIKLICKESIKNQKYKMFYKKNIIF